MRAFLCAAGLLLSLAAITRAAEVEEWLSVPIAPVVPSAAPAALPALEADLSLSPPSLAPSAVPLAVPAAYALPEARQDRSLPLAAPAGSALPEARQDRSLPFAAPAALPQAEPAEEPTDEDVQAARVALILRDPKVPPRVAHLIERELGLTSEDGFFDNMRARGSQPRNSHTNEPLGEAYRPLNPKQVIVGLFDVRQNSRAYYDSLKNARTGVVATGVRGGVDTMVEDLLEKGFLQPRSQGRNHRFLNGVYMDLPHHIHEARKYAKVDPGRAQGKDRYPMFLAFRAANVHNPGSDYQGKIVGDGGTLGHVALDKITPEDVVSIYVEKSRLAQTLARLKGTPLEHVQVLPVDVLPRH